MLEDPEATVTEVKGWELHQVEAMSIANVVPVVKAIWYSVRHRQSGMHVGFGDDLTQDINEMFTPRTYQQAEDRRLTLDTPEDYYIATWTMTFDPSPKKPECITCGGDLMTLLVESTPPWTECPRCKPPR